MKLYIRTITLIIYHISITYAITYSYSVTSCDGVKVELTKEEANI